MSTAIAIAGVVIALAGSFVNGWQIRSERNDRKQQISDEWAKEWAAQRPVVYPLPTQSWASPLDGPPYFGSNAKLVPLMNGGRGPALNVHGEIQCRSQSDG